MKRMSITGNEEVDTRARRLLVDAFVALTEKGNLTDEDIFLIKEHGLTEHVQEKLFQRAGCNGFDYSRMFDTGAAPLAWEEMEN